MCRYKGLLLPASPLLGSGGLLILPEGSAAAAAAIAAAAAASSPSAALEINFEKLFQDIPGNCVQFRIIFLPLGPSPRASSSSRWCGKRQPGKIRQKINFYFCGKSRVGKKKP